ncbi:MAG: hypothetical protein COT90_04175 [Candidatus Diapherotrites archaeon CG10_big_fil_rev_8_21_14_0_10_31_34]|nr:MAG: hypothetical protein COT90_04175 [Candidatus Diapherotrites archaeon CG10_big_fil_rev_8_21_14_0_10_31_34]
MDSRKFVFKFWFLILMILVYACLFLFEGKLFFSSTDFFLKILLNLIPVFVLVFVLMSLINFFVSTKTVSKYFVSSGKKSWLFAVVAGILSMGPVYIWYPFLQDLKEKGFNEGLIAVFLYNRAIKIPLIPLAVFYFGLKFVVILAFVMIVFSVIQGITINKLIEIKTFSAKN